MAVPGSNSSPSPSHHPWQISSQTCSRSWLGTLGGGRGRPWRSTMPVCRSCRSTGVCCCPPYHWAQRAAHPPAQKPTQPPALGSLSSIPTQNQSETSSQNQLPNRGSPDPQPCKRSLVAKGQGNRGHLGDVAAAQHCTVGIKASLFLHQSLSATPMSTN